MIRMPIVAAILALACTLPSARADVSEWSHDYAASIERARRERKPLFVLIAFRSGCHGCEILKAGLDGPGPHRELLERFVTVWVVAQGDRGAVGEGLGAFEIRHSGAPYTVIFDWRGNRFDETAGAMSRDGQTANMETYRKKLQGALDRIVAAEVELSEAETSLDLADGAAVEAFRARCVELGQPERALPAMPSRVDLDPTPANLLALGRLHLALGDLDEARRDFDRIDPSAGESSSARVELLVALSSAGRSNDACREAKAYLRRHPEGEGVAAARHCLVRTELDEYRRSGRPTPRALASIRKAIEEFLRLHPSAPQAEDLRRALSELPAR